VSPSHRIAPHRQLVKRRIVDVIGGVEAHHSRQKGPGPERAAGERGYVFWGCGGRVDGCGVVDTRGEVQGCVGLDGVAEGD
jgi:hypothetical protein